MTNDRVDGVLIAWGERWDWSPLNKKGGKPKKTSTGLFKAAKASGRPAMTPALARQNLEAFVRKSPQVLVKISGGAKGLAKVRNHLSYISRNGQLPLEDQDGEQVQGRESVGELGDLWGKGRFPIADESDKREAIHIVLSMPAGTSELSVLRAARQFARAEFASNHDYVMALHTFETDTAAKPSRHPHVHLAVKSRGRDGTRLNPRKADLADWREGFASALRDHGIQATATRRRTRLQRQKGEKQSLRQMKSRGASNVREQEVRPNSAAATRALQNAHQATVDFRGIAHELAKAGDEDRKLAVELIARLRELNAPVVKETVQRDAKSQGKDRS